jgi:hypothetical protein
MLKEYIVLILLYLLRIRESKAKEDVIEKNEIWDSIITFADAVGNCAKQPAR